mmetsp:Transcript_29445/g.84613  ORF Transcript_29445/g.84613 Transcript_29445/m.84613 type:complete len:343 (+) Transcript_29445:482-1510(+)
MTCASLHASSHRCPRSSSCLRYSLTRSSSSLSLAAVASASATRLSTSSRDARSSCHCLAKSASRSAKRCSRPISSSSRSASRWLRTRSCSSRSTKRCSCPAACCSRHRNSAWTSASRLASSRSRAASCCSRPASWRSRAESSRRPRRSSSSPARTSAPRASSAEPQVCPTSGSWAVSTAVASIRLVSGSHVIALSPSARASSPGTSSSRAVGGKEGVEKPHRDDPAPTALALLLSFSCLSCFRWRSHTCDGATAWTLLPWRQFGGSGPVPARRGLHSSRPLAPGCSTRPPSSASPAAAKGGGTAHLARDAAVPRYPSFGDGCGGGACSACAEAAPCGPSLLP